jgi:hypothetical protein
MADLTKTNAVKNGSVAATVNNAAASQTIVVTKDEGFCLYVRNADATSARVRVVKGDGIAGVMGDTYVDVAQNAEKIIGPLESARFADKDTGKITVNVTGTDDGAFGGTITNVKLIAIQL